MWYNVTALLGIVVILGTAGMLSVARDRVQWRPVVVSLALELFLGGVFFLAPGKGILLDFANRAVLTLIGCGSEGVRFLFGWLSTPPEGKYSLAVQALPLIIFFSAFISLLYHFGVMQRVIRALAWLFNRLFRISGAEALVAAGNIFVGIESALAVRPYLEDMTESELFLILTVGMATIASSVLGLYVVTLQSVFPDIAVHLMCASVLSAPAAVCVAKIIYPETGRPMTLDHVAPPHYDPAANAVDAVLRGANEGLKMVLGISAALIAFMGLVAVVNALLHLLQAAPGALWGWRADWSVQGILGWAFYPFTVLSGVPMQDAGAVAHLVGDRFVLTEVSSYVKLADLIRTGAISPRAAVVASYFLCGFAHVASLAIFTGGICALAPSRRPVLSRLSFRALLAANLACLLTGATAGLFYNAGVAVLTPSG